MKKIIYNRGAPIEYGLYGFIRHKKNYHIETYNLATIESRYEKAAIYSPHTLTFASSIAVAEYRPPKGYNRPGVCSSYRDFSTGYRIVAQWCA